MDILAARKRAAELAKAGKTTAENAAPVPAPERPASPVSGEAAAAAPASADAGEGGGASPAAQPDAPAAEIAAEAQEQPEQEQELEMLAFRLGREDYLVPVGLVAEGLARGEATTVPRVPSYILGVCSRRGVVLPIIDLSRRLG